jgi:hypothetical protein
MVGSSACQPALTGHSAPRKDDLGATLRHRPLVRCVDRHPDLRTVGERPSRPRSADTSLDTWLSAGHSAWVAAKRRAMIKRLRGASPGVVFAVVGVIDFASRLTHAPEPVALPSSLLVGLIAVVLVRVALGALASGNVPLTMVGTSVGVFEMVFLLRFHVSGSLPSSSPWSRRFSGSRHHRSRAMRIHDCRSVSHACRSYFGQSGR